MKDKVITKYRIEYWEDGRKVVRIFGSIGQRDNFMKEKGLTRECVIALAFQQRKA